MDAVDDHGVVRVVVVVVVVFGIIWSLDLAVLVCIEILTNIALLCINLCRSI